MRKPAFCICENKDADQLRGNREADQRLCFSYIDSTIPLLAINPSFSLICNFKPLAIFCGCTALFVSDLVENPEEMLLQIAVFRHPSYVRKDFQKLLAVHSRRNKVRI